MFEQRWADSTLYWRNIMFSKKITILDGAMGTMLQRAGLKLGVRPETLSITAPETVEGIQREYVSAGAQMILSNTFCANAHKLSGTGFSVSEVVSASVAVAKRACAGTETKVALDIGPIGEMLEPYGRLTFDEAYDLFKEIIEAGVDAGADAIFFETFSDLQEIRAGVLAAKETCALPVFASMTFEASGRTFLGCRADAAAMALSGLGVSAVGLNCSLGPVEASSILRKMRKVTDLPLILKPNAGLPDPQTGEYSLNPEEFAKACAVLTEIGAAYIGGCCATTPDFIRALSRTISGKEAKWQERTVYGVCAPGCVAAFGGVNVIGERINPTGKKRFAQALREKDFEYIAAQAIEQQEAGAQILDVNVGLPGIDEVEMMRKAVAAISAVCSLPLQIDSSDPAAIEAGLRAAPGKCLINSVSAKEESLKAILPLARKYGAALVGLTLGEEGLPADADQRISYAQKIISAAEKYGICREDIAIDCLTLTVSAQQEQVGQTLRALSCVREKFGVQTVLGVSNISFGLPQRDHITQAFLIQAIGAGLTLPIVNPNNRVIMDAIAACRVLSGEDVSAKAYIEHFAPAPNEEKKGRAASELTLFQAIEKGLYSDAAELARKQLMCFSPLELVENELIPALDHVGDAYEKQKIFLPQLMNAANAAGAAFSEIKKVIEATGQKGEKKGPFLLATVEGDIHDIGKDIVKTVVESYGYSVIDLGRDVKAERIVQEAKNTGAKIIGLSALMTTTVPSMKKTIDALHDADIHVPVIVGGAVLTPEFAKEIGADYYAKDAKQCADVLRSIFG